ncbi:hypothetical protein BE21_26110 [Sorangium cellulosum]|uniref:Secreted protein n=1 Tax=Sorangium cellulosum TaxID=56 RepID=A0A150TTH9_SORCE|nr:hypothetical protein BE21_26110 [Sorangium cellulosum]
MTTMRTAFLVGSLMALVAGCTDATVEAPIVWVQKLDRDHDCFATCKETLNQGVPPPAAARTCAGGSEAPACGLLGGEDSMRVIAQYYAREPLEFDAREKLASPELTLLLDDVPMAAPQPFSEATPEQGAPLFMASFRAPAREARTLSVRVKAAEGFVGLASGLTLDLRAPILDLSDCTAEVCEREAGVGKLVATLTAPVGVQGPNAIFTTRIDGVLQPQSEQLPLTPSNDGIHATAVAFLDTPPDEGAVWRIEARMQGLTDVAARDVTLRSPGILLAVENCASDPCTLRAKSEATLRVEGPAKILDKTALVSWKVGNVTVIDSFTVDLAQEEEGRVYGFRKVDVPATDTATTWQIKTVVGQSTFTLEPITIEP